jgi:glutamate synthase domain-containing protein 3
MLRDHLKYTGSEIANKLINDFARERLKFIKVFPIEYKRVLEEAELEEIDLKMIEKRLKQLEEISDG